MTDPFFHTKNVFFIGIGGIGMSALARYFNKSGKRVVGYDRVQSALTSMLEKEGIFVHFEDDTALIPNNFIENKEETLVVYTPAIPKNHKELNYFKENGFAIKKRSEVLGDISSIFYTIAVAGTHGKTTTSCLIAHLLRQSKIPSIAILGGVSSNYETNFWQDDSARTLITEADEYDRSFLSLHPDISVITSVDADHLDIYNSHKEMLKGYVDFADRTATNGTIILNNKIKDIFKDIPTPTDTYGIGQGDFCATNVEVRKNRFHFDLNETDFEMLQPGRHNIENALAVAAVAKQLEITNAALKEAFATFKGVKRRFEYYVSSGRIIYIDDYAHHPTELHAAISAAKELYPDKFITGIFQPHLYSRTKDFADEFAKSLSILDEAMLLPIYPAREEPIAGISSQLILDKITCRHKSLIEKTDLAEVIPKIQDGVLLTLGAGDIGNLTEKIKMLLPK